MQRTNTNSMSLLIEQFIKEEGLAEGLRTVRIYKAWDLVVGDAGAKATANKFFKDGTLYCTISSSMIRTQLFYRKEDIIVMMNKILNGDIVEKLILK